MNTEEKQAIEQLEGFLNCLATDQLKNFMKMSEDGVKDVEIMLKYLESIKNIINAFEDIKCIRCDTTEDLMFEPDPYESEMSGEKIKVFICSDCFNESLGSI